MELFTAIIINRYDNICCRHYPSNTLEEAYREFIEYCEVYNCQLLIVENAKNCTEIESTYESYRFFKGEDLGN